MDNQPKSRGVDRAAWEKAISDLEPANEHPTAVTMGEFRGLTGLTKEPAWRRMQALLKAGKVKRVQVGRRDSNGRRITVAAYVLLDSK